MKKLIFLPLLATWGMALAQTPQREIPTAEDSNAIVSRIKDVEVTQMIGETAEFKECKDKYPFEASDSDTQRSTKLQEATKCFQDKLKNKSDPEKLKKLSEALDLQSYKLVKSNSSKEIQEYLTDKMIEALTGVNPKETDENKKLESLKFQNRKVVDQSLFMQLYKTQLGKNALYEISRFCFEDLRNATPPANSTSFYEHWSSNQQAITSVDPGNPQTISDALAKVNDSGAPKFGTFSDTKDKSKIYTEIFNSIQGSSGGNNPAIQAFIQKYFLACGFLIEPLCKKFRDNADPESTDSQIDIGQTPPPTGTQPSNVGAAACLALNRIKEYKKAIADTEKVSQYMDEQMQGGNNLAQFMKGLKGEPIKVFGSGAGNEPTIDELTNNTASSLLQGNLADERAKDKAEECRQSPELAKCEGFVYKTEDLDKIKQKVELDQTLKREVEMARVKKLVEGDRQSLETYLKEKGFFDILEEMKNPSFNNDAIVTAVGKSFEAKKLAMLNEINNRLGSRQVKDDTELKSDLTKIDEAETSSQEERARLAQLVLFNNIITSHLSLQKRDSSGNLSSAGRNVGAWRKEAEALGQDQVDETLFQNLKASDTDGENGGGVGNAQIADFSLLDNILGKKD